MSPAATAEKSTVMPWPDPHQAKIPTIRDGTLAAVYYGQRRSGDFYDFVLLSSGSVLFGLFDVAGDLRETRSIIVGLQQKFRGAGAKLLDGEQVNEAERLHDLWLELNRTIMATAGGVRSCPAFLGCYNDEISVLSYVNAGHTPGLVRDRESVKELRATALPLGLFSHSVPESSVVALSSGQALLLASKGVTDAKYKGEEYGLDRVREYLQQAQFETAHETCVGLLSRVQQFMCTAPTHNDVTALAVVRSR